MQFFNADRNSINGFDFVSMTVVAWAYIRGRD